MSSEYRLILFITGNPERAQRIVQAINQLLNIRVPTSYELEVVDVLQDPARAEAEHILMTPTLVIKLPAPERRIFGDLDNVEKLYVIMDFGKPPALADAPEQEV
jgi:circadian clock protein KaiB